MVVGRKLLGSELPRLPVWYLLGVLLAGKNDVCIRGKAILNCWC